MPAGILGMLTHVAPSVRERSAAGRACDLHDPAKDVLIGAADDLIRPARSGAHSLCPARPELARSERPYQEARAFHGSIGWGSACSC